MAHDDIKLEEWDPTAWSKLPPEEAAKHLLDHVLAQATEAESWYRRRKGQRATLSRALRAIAIVLAAVGGLAPILAGLRAGAITMETATVISQLGYLFIGVAAGLMAFDRYFGVSTGWLRYVTALGAIQRLRAEFLFQWSELLLEVANPPTRHDLSRLVDKARSFRLAVIDIVARETDAWNTEFKSSFADLEKVVRVEREAKRKSEPKTQRGSASSGGRPPRKVASPEGNIIAPSPQRK
jgi:hypothetical protein